ncbi:hypothetical protein G6F47_012252 [Rhizopus delemar]|nr:hypothetical protein G6F54_010703 [Rhizopus delemar]KAG1502389.1 hypothetical protein G6F53_010862 [Rhizopus delemar]KAG1582275.1 hypothetical protein G6F47_012252 [Rhizopus delemar]
MLTCEICQLSFITLNSLKSHKRDQHSLAAHIILENGESATIFRESDSSKFKCFCQKYFETIRGFQRHYNRNKCAAPESLNFSQEDPLLSSTQSTSSNINDETAESSVADSSVACSESIKLLTDLSFRKFESSFKAMDDQMKWKLCSGRTVEDVLYDYGMELEREHAVHSFILDTSNPEMKKLFTGQEWGEITRETELETTNLPESILNLIQEMNKKNIKEVKRVLLKYAEIRYSDYPTSDEFHIDKICYAIESLLHLYERNPNPLLIKQQEQWYNSNVWVPVIDKFFGNLDGINCTRDNKSSFSSGKRKRESQERIGRKRIGYKPDMIIQAVREGNRPLEFGACEAASFYDGPTGKKYKYESRLKLPKTLKDMLFNLCQHVDWDTKITKEIEVIGYVQSGLVIEFIILNHPKGYICCMNRSKSYEIGSNMNNFAKTLEMLTVSLIMKLRLEKTMSLMNIPTINVFAVGFQHAPIPTLAYSIPTP